MPVFSFSALTKAQLLAAGGFTPGGFAFTMPAEADLHLAVEDDDPTLSGDFLVNNQPDDSTGQRSDITVAGRGVLTDRGVFAERVFVAEGDDQDRYLLVEIRDAGGVYYTFAGTVPPAGTALTLGPPREIPFGPSYDSLGAGPGAGFGVLSGEVDVSDGVAAPGPDAFGATIDFGTNAPGPEDAAALTEGAQALLADGLGSDAAVAEAIALDVLARGSDAGLAALGGEITYSDGAGSVFDYAATIDGAVLGVEVTRVVSFPFGDPLDPDVVAELIEEKLLDLQAAEANALSAGGEDVDGTLLVLFAQDDAAAAVIEAAYEAQPGPTQGDTTVLTLTTDGDDGSLYGFGASGLFL